MLKIFDYTMECDLNKSTIFISLGVNVSQYVKAKFVFTTQNHIINLHTYKPTDSHPCEGVNTVLVKVVTD